MNDVRSVDLAVIGLGSGGEQVATLAAQQGLDVVGFEPGRVGGECPFVACIPSKAMLHDVAGGQRPWADAVARRRDLVNDLDDAGHAKGLREAGAEIVRASARLVGERCVEADGQRYRAENVVIATGAGPKIPDVPGADHPDHWTSSDALTGDELPARLAIIGGGPIGCELSQVFARFGSTVTLIDHSEHLHGNVEPELSEGLRDVLADDGVDVRLRTDLSSITEAEGSFRLALQSGDDVTVDRVLFAIGVEPRTDTIGLAAVGIVDLSVDHDLRVAGQDWLWGVGDVTGWSHWTHGATYQARSLVDRLTGSTWVAPPTVMPSAVFTHPPLARVGITAAQAREQGHDVIVGQADYDRSARARTDEIERGQVAVIVDRPSGAFLGASIFGRRADDLIQIVTAWMTADVTLDVARRTVFPFPTLSQVVEAAVDDAHDQT